MDHLYKIYFSKLTDDIDENYNLTFYSIQNLNLTYSQFPTFLRKFNDLSRKKTTHTLQKMNKIIPYGNSNIDEILQFYVILFSNGENQEDLTRKGYFIGKNKANQYKIYGFWPFYRKDEIMNQPALISQELDQLVEDPKKFHDIIMINK